MTARFRFPPQALSANAEALRHEVRAFLAEHGRNWSLRDRVHSWMGFDRAFSRAVGARGWIGMTWPKRYGGGERSSLERYVALDAGDDVSMMGAIAKIRAGEAVAVAAPIAHQVHGAIGVTDEHMLHYYTRRLWQWRRDHDSDAHWAEWLGREVQDSAVGLWSILTARRGVAPARAAGSC